MTAGCLLAIHLNVYALEESGRRKGEHPQEAYEQQGQVLLG